jgi:hypothetical protein
MALSDTENLKATLVKINVKTMEVRPDKSSVRNAKEVSHSEFRTITITNMFCTS